jgi:hypothetical protein
MTHGSAALNLLDTQETLREKLSLAAEVVSLEDNWRQESRTTSTM